MPNATRNDVHRPSVINPDDYRYVAQEVLCREGFEDVSLIRSEREKIAIDMARTGGTYSTHEHGGNCMCCGSPNAIYTTLFHHEPTNTYVRMGSTCAEKCDMGDAIAFRAIKAAVKDARQAKAGRQKAFAMLADKDLGMAWEIFENHPTDKDTYEIRTVRDIVGKLVKYGAISERQYSFLDGLLKRIIDAPKLEAAREIEKAAASPAPRGRGTYEVTVLGLKRVESYYGPQTKMLVKHESGWTAWGTCPSCSGHLIERGSVIELTATFTQVANDPKYAFFKRPSGRVLETV